ncbi:MAG: glycyl-tRNA synthetase beta chain [Deltaproteobacteria bacterium]|nr:glycyl-tRNA synthetase beta chain [Deltaproteobacteria bacterium]
MDLKELFLEIGTEEIPAGFVPKALEEMDALIRKELSSLRIKHCEVKIFGTPRRLVLSVSDVADRQEDISIQVMGPAKKAAYDDKGNLTKAAEGFVRSQGVDPSQLKVVETPKGEYLAVQKEEKGRPTADLLEEVLPRLISSIHFRKSMRWRDLDVRFARPIHWIVALFGGDVVPFSFGEVKSGNESRGHRFMAPGTFKVSGLADYLDKTEKAFVIVDQDKRKEMIMEQVNKLDASVSGLKIVTEDLFETVTYLDLLETINYLVEYPVGLMGSFDEEFLSLPEEVLITSMKKHQKYFYVKNRESGKLLPYFIAVSNTAAKDIDVVRKGNERVLRARLSDAAFFYNEDKKIPLEKRVEKLKGVVFQAKLGTVYEKMERFKSIAEFLADILKPEVKETVSRAAYLCKADLVTGMVGEFPELQGIMGREYARVANEDADVAAAIYDHYLPRFAEDGVPVSDAGAILSIADRIDTICGCFGIGQIPTGATDPFALRRHTIAIINIILTRNYRVSISRLADKAIELLSGKITRPAEDVKKEVMEYMRVRLLNLLTGNGDPADVVDAVLSANFDDIVRSVKIVKALSEIKKMPDFEPLAIAFKRAVNITKGTVRTSVNPSLFGPPAEKELYDASASAKTTISLSFEKENFTEALEHVSHLKAPVDAFFDDVLVMDKDEKIKNNRLALLWGVSDIFSGIADFSKITTTSGQ